MKVKIVSTVDQVSLRCLATFVFGQELKHNLKVERAYPAIFALYKAMCQVELSFEEWVTIIKSLLPEIETYQQLVEVLEIEAFTYTSGNVGEKQLQKFCHELKQKVN